MVTFYYDVVRRAYLFASKAHGQQIYAEEGPYYLHLQDVMMVLIEFGVDQPELLAAALLHDVIEDTPNNYHDIKSQFGEVIADIVYAVTDELGKSRKERKEKTLPKIKLSQFGRLIKLADWIANVRQCYRNSHKMYQMYKKDYPEFRKLKDTVDEADSSMSRMWNELDILLSENESKFVVGVDKHHSEYDEIITSEL
jgi:(p)ppGpp synthase/HD superfamily hydrolase